MTVRRGRRPRPARARRRADRDDRDPGRLPPRDAAQPGHPRTARGRRRQRYRGIRYVAGGTSPSPASTARATPATCSPGSGSRSRASRASSTPRWSTSRAPRRSRATWCSSTRAAAGSTTWRSTPAATPLALALPGQARHARADLDLGGLLRAGPRPLTAPGPGAASGIPCRYDGIAGVPMTGWRDRPRRRARPRRRPPRPRARPRAARARVRRRPRRPARAPLPAARVRRRRAARLRRAAVARAHRALGPRATSRSSAASSRRSSPTTRSARSPRVAGLPGVRAFAASRHRLADRIEAAIGAAWADAGIAAAEEVATVSSSRRAPQCSAHAGRPTLAATTAYEAAARACGHEPITPAWYGAAAGGGAARRRLAVVGNAVLEAAFSTAQYVEAPWASEAEMSEERRTATSNAALAERAHGLGLSSAATRPTAGRSPTRSRRWSAPPRWTAARAPGSRSPPGPRPHLRPRPGRPPPLTRATPRRGSPRDADASLWVPASLRA